MVRIRRRFRDYIELTSDGKPGSHCVARVFKDPEIERRVIRLPDLVGTIRFAAIHEVEALAMRLGSPMRQRRETRIEVPDESVGGAVAGSRPTLLARNGPF